MGVLQLSKKSSGGREGVIELALEEQHKREPCPDLPAQQQPVHKWPAFGCGVKRRREHEGAKANVVLTSLNLRRAVIVNTELIGYSDTEDNFVKVIGVLLCNYIQ